MQKFLFQNVISQNDFRCCKEKFDFSSSSSFNDPFIVSLNNIRNFRLKSFFVNYSISVKVFNKYFLRFLSLKPSNIDVNSRNQMKRNNSVFIVIIDKIIQCLLQFSELFLLFLSTLKSLNT